MDSLKSFLRPGSIAEALRMRVETPGRGAYIAGGTDIVAADDPSIDFLVDISRLGLHGISGAGGGCVLGATTPLADIVRHPALAGLADGLVCAAASTWGTNLIRERATIGGVLAGAHPSTDLAAALIALEAEVIHRDGAGEHRTPAESFHLGDGATALGLGILTAIEIPAAAHERRGAHERVSRTRVDLTLVGADATRRAGRSPDWRLALCGVSDRPLLIPTPELESALHLDDSALGGVARRIQSCLCPPDDHRASAEYRRTVAGVLARRVLTRLLESS